MRFLLIEDEAFTAQDLADNLLRLRPSCQIEAILPSVAEARNWLNINPQPDLFFSDIQLGDGLSFDLFRTHPPKVPVIFCTAYDQFALEAFRHNGIDYLLKPYRSEDLEKALQKWEQWKSPLPQPDLFQKLQALLAPKTEPVRAQHILVYYKDQIIPLAYEDIALCISSEGRTLAYDFEGNRYPLDRVLDELEEMNFPWFFRTNRQSLVHRRAIGEIRQYLGRRLWVQPLVKAAEPLLISKEKVPLFLQWLEGGVRG